MSIVTTMLAVLKLDDSQFKQGMTGAKTEAKKFGNSMSDVKRSWGNFFNAAQMASVPLGAALIKGVADAAAFDTALAQISARTGTTGDELDRVRALAIEMGRKTKFSAQDAANGMLELLSSGDDVNTAMERLPEVLKLAAAGGLDLKTSADGLTDIMAAMGLEAGKSADTVQSLFSASASSSATVQDLIDGFANVGPVARNFGLNVDDASGYLAVLAENGIKGSEAGTALKSMLLNMTRQTDETQGAWDALGTSLYDADGNMRNLNVVLGEIDRALSSKSAEEQNDLMKALGGSYGVVALSALRASGGIGDMQKNMSGAADAGDVAAANMDTFEGRLDALKGSIQTLNVEAFTPFMNDVLKPIVEDFTDVINKVTEFATENPELTETVLAVAGAFVVGTGALTALGVILNVVTTGIGALITTALSPLGIVLGVGTILVAAYLNNWMGFRDFVDGTVRPAIERIIERIAKLTEGLRAGIQLLEDITSGKYNIGEVLKAGGNAIGNEISSNAAGTFARRMQGTATVLSNGASAEQAATMNTNSMIADTVLNSNPILSIVAGAARMGWNLGSGRASGGPVMAGMPYRVGENGVETFVPEQNGSIMPNGAMGSPTINVYQLPGEDGVMLADRVSRKMVQLGYARS